MINSYLPVKKVSLVKGDNRVQNIYMALIIPIIGFNLWSHKIVRKLTKRNRSYIKQDVRLEYIVSLL